MRNIFTICGKELKSYFTSPIAYLLMALFGLIFGYFFFSATVFFVNAGLRQQLGGQQQPMSINEYVISPLLGNASVVGLFLIPLISMRLFAEEKRTGTIELLMTSPISDWEIILGKWLGAMSMYLCVLAVSALNVALLFAWGRPDWRPILTGFISGSSCRVARSSRSVPSYRQPPKTRSLRAPQRFRSVCCFGC